MPAIDLSILNQRQTPAFFASSLATRPAFGFAGRIFIDTDSPSTGLYRDTGSAWVQIADPGAGTTGTLQQVTTNGNTTTLAIIANSFQGNAIDGTYFLRNEDVEFTNVAIGNSFRLVGRSNTDRGFIYFGATGNNYLGYDGTNLVLNSSVTIPSLTSGSVPFIGASGLISQDNANLFWDATNGHLGIGTNVPGTALDVKHDQNTVVQLEQVTATNDNRIAFINNGVGLWRLGSFYNAGANDFGLFDIAAATQPVTVKRTTGQVLIGTSTVGSGKLVVASSIGDNGVQIVGAAAPSLRIDNAESGPTKRVGLGISTAANNFIQGSVDRDFCIFNGSTTASPILFGIYDTTNVAEAARISAARNFLIGTTTDNGNKLQVTGSGNVSGSFGIGTISPSSKFEVLNTDTNAYNPLNTLISGQTMRITNNSTNSGIAASLLFNPVGSGGGNGLCTISGVSTGTGSADLTFAGRNSGGTIVEAMRLTGIGNLLINTTTDAGFKLDVNGTFRASNVLSGTYVPTATNTGNLTAISPQTCQYMRVGNVVNVSGVINITPTAGGGVFFDLSLPVTNGVFANFQQAGGTGVTNVNYDSYKVNSSSGTFVVTYNGLSTFPAGHSLYFSFQYLIV